MSQIQSLKFSDNLNLSLEKLEINPERQECSKTDENPFSYGVQCPLREASECSLETLSLNAVCPKGNCLCNKKRDGGSRIASNNCSTSTSLKSIVHHRRPIIRRSKLNREVLRAPILRLGGSDSGSEGSGIGKTCTSFKSKIDGSNTKSRTSAEPVALCYSASSSLSSSAASTTISGSTLDRTAVTPPLAPNYLTMAASSSHCCALQARAVNNNASNNSNLIVMNANPSSSTSSTDDTNIDELASYFDLLVHIPKKMSLMAEMMYI